MADYTEQQLAGALRKADAAGDTAAAKAIARRIQSMREAGSIAKQQEATAAQYAGTGTDQYGAQAPEQAPAAGRPTGLLGFFAGPAPIQGDTPEARQADYQGRNPLLKAAVGVGQMMDSNIRGANQLAGTVNPAMDERARAGDEMTAGDLPTAAGNVGANFAALYAPGGMIAKIPSLLPRIGAGVALGAGSGALQAENAPGQRVTNTLVGGAFGAGGELAGVALRGMANKAASNVDPIRQRAMEFAKQQDIPLHISQISQSVPVKALASTAKYLPFSGAGKAGARQQEAFNRAVSRTFGADAGQLSDDVTWGARKNLSGQFEDIYGRNNVPLGETGLRRLSEVERGAALRLTKDEAQVVRNQMDSILGELDDMGAMTGQKYQALRTQIMKAEGPDKVGQAVGELRKALDDIAADAVGPEDAARLKQIRGQWANLRTTENMLKQVAGAGGDVKPSAIWPAIRKGSTREMRELGRLGQTILKDPIPDSGTPGRVLSLGLLGGGGVTGGVGALPTIGALLAGGATVGRALNSTSAANLMLSGQRSAPAGLRSLARLAGPGAIAASPAAAAAIEAKERRRLKGR